MAGQSTSARSRAGVLLATPALAAICLFFFMPTLGALLLGFTGFDIYALADPANVRWVGLANYAALLRDPAFHQALRNTAYFVAVGVPLSITLSLVAAVLLHERVTRGHAIFPTLLFLPVVTTIVAVAVVWRYVYQPRSGLLNDLLAAFGVTPHDWLGDPLWAMPAIILLAVWKNFGFHMLIFLAALQSIPDQFYEAAALDGAGSVARHRHVTLPMLAPTFRFVAVITLAGYFQLFAEPYVLTAGGPADWTLSVVLLMYREGFRWWNMGYAPAVAVMLFGIIVAAGASRSAPSRCALIEDIAHRLHDSCARRASRAHRAQHARLDSHQRRPASDPARFTRHRAPSRPGRTAAEPRPAPARRPRRRRAPATRPPRGRSIIRGSASRTTMSPAASPAESTNETK